MQRLIIAVTQRDLEISPEAPIPEGLIPPIDHAPWMLRNFPRK
jgi:hypothetical protein